MLIQPGVSEISLWGELKAGLEVQAGGRLPVLADLVAGVRTGEMGGLPGAYVLQEGDPVIADIVPRLDGYWGDICGTHFVGAPPAEMAKIRGIVRDALRRGIDAVRPGVIARELDAMLRETIRAAGYEPYPHHSGHGIGVSYHEEPRLVPYNDMALAPGMVVRHRAGHLSAGRRRCAAGKRGAGDAGRLRAVDEAFGVASVSLRGRQPEAISSLKGEIASGLRALKALRPLAMTITEGVPMTERKRAIITGASSGVGRAAAVRFAAEGWDVCLTARRANELEQLRERTAAGRAPGLSGRLQPGGHGAGHRRPGGRALGRAGRADQLRGGLHPGSFHRHAAGRIPSRFRDHGQRRALPDARSRATHAGRRPDRPCHLDPRRPG